jgi:putative metallohydrolase (TIGR04338 family)
MSDPQRQRLYAAEQVIKDNYHFRSLAKMQEFVDTILASDYWTERCGVGKVTVFLTKFGAQVGKAHYGGSWRGKWVGHPFITIPGSWGATKQTLLHELAHIMTRGDRHGAKYAEAYLGLVQQFMGQVSYKALKRSFDEHGVAYGQRQVKHTNTVKAEARKQQSAKSDRIEAAEAFLAIARMVKK